MMGDEISMGFPKRSKDKQSKFGKIIHKDVDLFFNDNQENKQGAAIFYLLIGIILCSTAIYLGYILQVCYSLILWTIGLLLFVFVFLTIFYKTGNFKIFERGIRFSNLTIPFIYFDDIVAVEERKFKGSSIPYLSIKLKSGQIYSIASNFRLNLTERPGDYYTTKKIIMERFKMNKVERFERDKVKSMDWSDAAFREISTTGLDMDSNILKINKIAAAKGKTRVELKDVKDFRNKEELSKRKYRKEMVKKIDKTKTNGKIKEIKKVSKPNKQKKTRVKKVTPEETETGEPPKFLEKI